MDSYVRQSSRHLSRISPAQWFTIELRRFSFPVYYLGMQPLTSSSAIICLPNQASTAERFIVLGQLLQADNDTSTAVIALGHPDSSYFWFPKPTFDAPLELQQPYLSMSLAAIEQLCQRLAQHIPIDAISLFGFADSACLALEYLVRCGYPLNAVIAPSGLLLGTSLDTSDRFNTASTRTKVFLSIGGGISAAQRVRFRQTEQLLKQCGYKVVTYTSERRPETISPAELEMAR
ncbi:MAG: hypothetical protein NZ481_09735, partial [Candidatus Kapabacteria bacterium]|nr:hypothetical protein [Candidatus Kapabacteria bacterium]